MKEGANTGIYIKPLSPTDWVVSGETGIPPIILEQSGQWDQYLPDEESQASFNPVTFDGNDCVTFSATNNVEIIIQRLRDKGLLPATHEAFLQTNGYISKVSGKVNFSDRFTAKMSGTTINGNNLGAVAESIRKLHGLLPQSDWDRPTFPADYTPEQRWALYYAEVPMPLQVKAKKFLDYFTIQYHWVAVGTSTPSMLKEQLSYGPLQIAAQVCSPWASNDGQPPIKPCGCTPGHGTTIYGWDEAGDFKDFDHYKSFRKLLAANYCIPYAVQYALTPKSLAPVGPFRYSFTINLSVGADATEVHALQQALQTLKDKTGKVYMTPGVFGAYGPATKAALARFQADHGIIDDGSNFGPKTRAIMNIALNS